MATLARLASQVSADHSPRWQAPLRAAQTLRSAGRSRDAQAAYEAVIDINPVQPEALLGLAALLMTAGQDLPRAQLLLLRCCGAVPGRAEAWDALGVSLVLTGDLAAAESAFAEAQRLAPAVIDYALHRAEAAHAVGTTVAELARLGALLERDPLDVPSLAARALLSKCQGDYAAAADLLETATALRPDSAAILALLASVFGALNRPAQAEAMLARVTALDPDNPQPKNDRAVMLLRMQRPAAARTLLLDLVAEQGAQPGALCNLANAYVALGEQDQAVCTAEAAIALAPDAHLPRRTLCNALPYRQGVGGAALLDAARACAERLPRAPRAPWANAADPDRRLRLGLLSGSLKVHPVGWLTLAGFEALEPRAFELVGLAQATANDPMARRFRSIARDWCDVSAVDNRALAELARARGIDILIDLGGYGEAGRMGACAWRLAPVQMKWVGMQNHSTGLPEMDWFITDRWETPPGFEPFYTERLLRLTDGYVCYSPPADAPDGAPLPLLQNGFVTFGCFNNLAKITPAVIATWASILRRLPTSRLILKSHPFNDAPTRDRVQAAFAAHGIAAERIEPQGASPHRRLLAEYGRVDIVLDPFPYSGGLTTCEALWMGVPVLTLPGETFASRHSTSHLCNIGLDDWVAADRASYAAMAAEKVSDPAALADLRSGLRARMRASPLCDGPRFGRNLGAALRLAWQAWCRDQVPPTLRPDAS